MKKILLSLVLMFSILTTYTSFGDFQIKTTIPKNRQESYKLEINKVYKKFKDKLAKLSIDKQVSNARDIALKISNLLTKKQSERATFILSYLKYLLNEDLDYLNVRLLEYIKNAEKNKPVQCSS
jgi:ABC-type xylose transport system substrate-binding protein